MPACHCIMRKAPVYLITHLVLNIRVGARLCHSIFVMISLQEISGMKGIHRLLKMLWIME